MYVEYVSFMHHCVLLLFSMSLLIEMKVRVGRSTTTISLSLSVLRQLVHHHTSALSHCLPQRPSIKPRCQISWYVGCAVTRTVYSCGSWRCYLSQLGVGVEIWCHCWQAARVWIIVPMSVYFSTRLHPFWLHLFICFAAFFRWRRLSLICWLHRLDFRCCFSKSRTVQLTIAWRLSLAVTSLVASMKLLNVEPG